MIKYVADKLHIKGHTEQWCLENCHPDIFTELNYGNTVVCEKTNFWLDNFRYISNK
jgi:hypothetical protein